MTEPKTVRLKFSVLRCDEPMANGNVYPRALVERELLKYQHAIAHGRAFGPVGDKGKVMLADAAFVVREAKLEGNAVAVQIELLPTNGGEELKHHLGAFRLAPMGMGTVKADGTVGDDYILIGFGIVEGER